jgi:hypothetical protein
MELFRTRKHDSRRTVLVYIVFTVQLPFVIGGGGEEIGAMTVVGTAHY